MSQVYSPSWRKNVLNISLAFLMNSLMCLFALTRFQVTAPVLKLESAGGATVTNF